MDQVKVIVGAEATGVDQIGTVNKELTNLKDNSASLNKELINVKDATSLLATGATAVASALGAWKLKEYAQDATLLAARVETLGAVMKVVGNNAGYTGAEMEAFAKGVAKCGITTEESRQAVVRMAQNNLDLTKSSELARIAQNAAVIANTNSSEAFKNMILGMSTGQAIILHHMGLMVNFERAYMTSAAQLGKHTTELTENERAQARLNEVIRVSTGINGAYEAAMGTAGKQLTSLKRYHDELKLSIGELFTPALSESVNVYTEALKVLLKFMTDNKGTVHGWAEDFGDIAHGIGVALKGLNPWADHSESGGFKNFMPLSRYGYVESPRAQKEAAQEKEISDWKNGPKSLEDERDQYARINEAKEEKRKTEQAAKDLADRKALQALQKEWKKVNLDITDLIEESEGDITIWAKKIATVNKKADEELAKFGKVPGAKERIEAGRQAGIKIINTEEYQEYSNTFDGLIEKIRALNPDMTEHQRKILAVDDTVAKLKQKMPEYAKSWDVYGESMKKALELDKEIKNSDRMTPRQQKQFDDMAATNKWEVDAFNTEQEREKERFDHANTMVDLSHQTTQNKYAEISNDSNQSQLTKLAMSRMSILEQFNFEQEQDEAQTQWKLEHVAGEEEQIARIQEAYRARKVLAEQKLDADLRKNDQQTALAKTKMTADMFGNMAGAADTFYRLSNNKSKEAFRAYQAMKSAETLITTASATMKAFDDGCEINYWVGIAYATATAAMGAAQLATIWSASPDGGSGSGSSSLGAGASSGGPGALSNYSMPSDAASAANQPTWNQTKQSGDIHIYLQGDSYGVDKQQVAKWWEEVVVPVAREAGSRGVTITA